MTIKIEHQIAKDDDSVLIISSPTGIFYTGQCGGLGCTHPKYEGFAIQAGKMGQDLDICGSACADLWDMPEEAEALAKVFDAYAKEYTNGWIYNVGFDFSRVKEMEESWIPVIINGKIGHDSKEILIDQPGILFTNNNCD